MTERPILFSAPMVRAILAGHKTQTRRVVKGVALEWLSDHNFTPDYVADPGNFLCPFGFTGDALWVREAFSSDWILHQTPPREWPSDAPIHYWADGNPEYGDWTPPKPSIHMPRWASRITLEVENVRVERLQGITEADARAEGIERLKSGRGFYDPTVSKGMVHLGHYLSTATEAFSILWDSINDKRPGRSWADNPWVWVVTFKRVAS